MVNGGGSTQRGIEIIGKHRRLTDRLSRPSDCASLGTGALNMTQASLGSRKRTLDSVLLLTLAPAVLRALQFVFILLLNS